MRLACVVVVAAITAGARGAAARPHMPPPPPPSRGCADFVRTTGYARLGLGGEYATGWQDSEAPVDHRVSSFGMEARLRIAPRFAMMTRLDRSSGRDAALDADGDGRDDLATGTVTRWSVLGGTSVVLDAARVERVPRALELDLLGGYLSARGANEASGLAAGVDLSYQLATVRGGVRFVQGFGDAEQSRAVLAHVGIVSGGAPSYDDGDTCVFVPRLTSSPFAMALDLALSGWAREVGYVAPGLGVEIALHPGRSRLDALGRFDLLAFPNGDRDRVVHQSLLFGARLDLGKPGTVSRNGFFFALLGGYAFAAAPSSSTYGSTPVADLSIAWGGQGPSGGGFLRLHGRVSVPDADVVAIFLSLDVEVRLDRERWQDRD
jgi:hypothetical protein